MFLLLTSASFVPRFRHWRHLISDRRTTGRTFGLLFQLPRVVPLSRASLCVSRSSVSSELPAVLTDHSSATQSSCRPPFPHALQFGSWNVRKATVIRDYQLAAFRRRNGVKRPRFAATRSGRVDACLRLRNSGGQRIASTAISIETLRCRPRFISRPLAAHPKSSAAARRRSARREGRRPKKSGKLDAKSGEKIKINKVDASKRAAPK